MTTTNGRLLWVDDEIDLLHAHILFLENRGYAVRTASSGLDAAERCRTERFDLILLDENMPGLSGLDTLQRIKDVQPDVPVVMVTKNEAEDLMDQAIGSKIADYLIKPVKPSQILLTLKKNIHRREIVSEAAQTGYRQDFMQIGMQMDDSLDWAGWTDLYRRLVRWELELSETESPMAELLQTQKDEADRMFARYVRRNYENWLGTADAPPMSPDVVRREVLPRLDRGRQVYLLVFDNFRYDQWRALAPDLSPLFDIDEEIYCSILPTSTQYARNALFAGLMPADIRRLHPDLWTDEEAEESKNQHEAELLGAQLARHRRTEPFTYRKINDTAAAAKVLDELPQLARGRLNVFVVNFIDILSHARTESRMVRELARDEAAYRSLTRAWLRHSPLGELLRRLSQSDCDIIVTTDHGSIRVKEPLKVVGDRNVNTNLRYKLGKNLSYPAKDVFEMKRPERFGLPAPNLSTTYICATGSRFFAYPNNYNHYVGHYRDTFQHGGVSMEEMLVPLAVLRPRKRPESN
ncbi:MAG: PglZ domain-containing protein [Prevotellaceae bacterium]|nr:PglZ domain-containing protein [Prevotellaceae bacterium]